MPAKFCFDGREHRRACSRATIWRLGVGRTFQVAATFGSMTVVENVQMALISHARETYRLLARRARTASRPRARAARPGRHARRRPSGPSSELAYGDVKRVELAIALANEPRLLLMDEPTAGMAPRERNELIALVKQLVVERAISVLFTEHSMDVVFAFADRIIVLARGRLIADGTAGGDPRRSAGARGLFRHRQDVRGSVVMSGVDARRSRMLERLVRRRAQILYDLSFEVGRGEVVALMGRNGAGKSTTMKAIMGLMAQAAGHSALPATISRPCRLSDRPARPRLHAGGPPHLHRPHGDGESRRRPAAGHAVSPTAHRRRPGRRSSSSRCFPISPRCRTGPAAA